MGPWRISVVVPTLDEAAHIEATLQRLQALRVRGHEVVVVDAGSADGTGVRARPLCDRIVNAPRGRARQLNAGAQAARGDIYWFLHADTLVPETADLSILRALPAGRPAWGHFDVRLSGAARSFRVIEAAQNLRARLTGVATGDQGMFVERELFRSVGGFPEQPLMEDVQLSKQLRQRVRPLRLRERLVTSSRRWEHHGVLRTVVLMWWLRLAYICGVRPSRLARWYASGGRGDD